MFNKIIISTLLLFCFSSLSAEIHWSEPETISEIADLQNLTLSNCFYTETTF